MNSLFLLAATEQTFGETLRDVAESPYTTWAAIAAMAWGILSPKIKLWLDSYKPTPPGTVPLTPGVRPTQVVTVADATKAAVAATEANNARIKTLEEEIARLKADNAVWGNLVVQPTPVTVPGVVTP